LLLLPKHEEHLPLVDKTPRQRRLPSSGSLRARFAAGGDAIWKPLLFTEYFPPSQQTSKAPQ
jgi:hypothetical protein